MKICYRAHDAGKDSASGLAKKVKELGFDGVQLVLNKAINGESGLPGTLNNEKVLEIKKAFLDENLEIAMLGAYFNPVHSNKDLVNTSILKFKEHLKYANTFSTKFVGTETGSFNDDKWTYNPLNRTPEAFETVKEIMSDLANYAKEVNSNIAIEGADGHCMFEPKALKKLFDEIDNGHVFIIVDIYNYLNINNHLNHKKIFDECLELFNDKIVIFHMKDYIVKEEKLVQVGLGQGLMDFNYILPKIKEQCPNAYLIFEGVMPIDVKSSLELIYKYID